MRQRIHMILQEGKPYKFWYAQIQENFEVRDDEEFIVFVPSKHDGESRRFPGVFYHRDGTRVVVDNDNMFALQDEIIGPLDLYSTVTRMVGRKTKIVEPEFGQLILSIERDIA